MKNHKYVDGKLLQTNKKWSQLKQSQREWIAEITRDEYKKFIIKYKFQPRKKKKDIIVDIVYDKINKRDIWIPFYEAKTAIYKIIDRQNRRTSFDVEGESVTLRKATQTELRDRKEIPQKITFESLTDDEKNKFQKLLERQIGLSINQTGALPAPALQKSHKKYALTSAHKKINKDVVKRLINDKIIVELYEALSVKLWEQYQTDGRLPFDTKKEKRLKSLFVLESDRLTFWKMTPNDWLKVRKMISDKDVMYAWERTYESAEDIKGWISKQQSRYDREKIGYYLAVSKKTKQTIGQIGLMWNEINGVKVLEVGYILIKEHWHKGYATEGAFACIKYGFEKFDVDKIVAAIRPENTSSIAVAERLGMALNGEYDKEFEGKTMRHLIYEIRRDNLLN